jgi:hypothetical protein
MRAVLCWRVGTRPTSLYAEHTRIWIFCGDRPFIVSGHTRCTNAREMINNGKESF